MPPQSLQKTSVISLHMLERRKIFTYQCFDVFESCPLRLTFCLGNSEIHSRGGHKGLRYWVIFGAGFAIIFISKYGIAVFKVQAVCGNFKFYVAVIGEKIVVSR